jgi:hypothetical protein
MAEISNWTGKALAAPAARGYRNPIAKTWRCFLLVSANYFLSSDPICLQLKDRPSAQQRHPFVVTLRKKLITDGVLVEKNGFLTFSKDAEFSSPSAAAAVVHGGGANGLTEWKTKDGTTLKELDE